MLPIFVGLDNADADADADDNGSFSFIMLPFIWSSSIGGGIVIPAAPSQF